jgi:hypothetical protein
LIIHTIGYERIKYLLCQELYTTNIDSPLNKQGINIEYDNNYKTF